MRLRWCWLCVPRGRQLSDPCRGDLELSLLERAPLSCGDGTLDTSKAKLCVHVAPSASLKADCLGAGPSSSLQRQARHRAGGEVCTGLPCYSRQSPGKHHRPLELSSYAVALPRSQGISSPQTGLNSYLPCSRGSSEAYKI